MAGPDSRPTNPDDPEKGGGDGDHETPVGPAAADAGADGAAHGNPGLNPWELLQEARKIVPFLDYAVGVVGLAAAAAIVIFFLGYSRAAIFAIAAVLIGAILLFAISRLALSRNKASQFAGVVVLWAVIIFFLTFLGFTISAVAAGQPCNWAEVLGVTSQCSKSPAVACSVEPNDHTGQPDQALGVAPIYPPREGVQIGDLYAVEQHSGADGFRAKTALLTSVDMRPEIQAWAKSRYHYVADKAAVNLVPETIDSFPTIEVDSGVTMSATQSNAASSPARLRLTMRFDGVTSSEVPPIVGEERLAEFCESEAGYLCENAYAANAINQRYALGPNDSAEVRAAGVLLVTKVYRATQVTYRALCASAADAMGVTAVASPLAPLAGASNALETKDPALIEAMADLTKALTAVPGDQTGSSTSSLKALADNSVIQTFVRPVVIGYESVSVAGRPEPNEDIIEPDVSSGELPSNN